MTTQPTPVIRKVILAGHCSADSASLSWLATHAMNVPAVRVNSDDALATAIAPDALLWINRVLEGSFAAPDGLALIKQLKQLAPQQHPSTTPATAHAQGVIIPMMLITNYPDVQAAAVAAGALPGFGKADLTSPALLTRLAIFAGKA